MYSFMLGIATLSLGVLFTIGKWTVDWFRDPKALRRFPNYSAFSGVTNLPYMILSYKNFRSKRMHELHVQGE